MIPGQKQPLNWRTAPTITQWNDKSGTAPIIAWDFAESVELGVHAELWVSTNLVDWVPLPSSHYAHSKQSENGKTRHEVEVTHDYGDRVFLRLQKP